MITIRQLIKTDVNQITDKNLKRFGWTSVLRTEKGVVSFTRSCAKFLHRIEHKVENYQVSFSNGINQSTGRVFEIMTIHNQSGRPLYDVTNEFGGRWGVYSFHHGSRELQVRDFDIRCLAKWFVDNV